MDGSDVNDAIHYVNLGLNNSNAKQAAAVCQMARGHILRCFFNLRLLNRPSDIYEFTNERACRRF